MTDTPKPLADWSLTEPVTCSTCAGVSVNGGTIHCHGCYSRLREENEKLRGALERYGVHPPACGLRNYEKRECTCGLTAALKGENDAE